jgi:hypothetical protein
MSIEIADDFMERIFDFAPGEYLSAAVPLVVAADEGEGAFVAQKGRSGMSPTV